MTRAKRRRPLTSAEVEARRETTQVLLRVRPEIRDMLDRLAEAWGVPRSEVVARLVAYAIDGPKPSP